MLKVLEEILEKNQENILTSNYVSTWWPFVTTIFLHHCYSIYCVDLFKYIFLSVEIFKYRMTCKISHMSVCICWVAATSSPFAAAVYKINIYMPYRIKIHLYLICHWDYESFFLDCCVCKLDYSFCWMESMLKCYSSLHISLREQLLHIFRLVNVIFIFYW